ncbi:MAG: glycosyltransferase family 1 protein [Zoogloeaceae bacterium]|nr:glycosyltransferase family 1 protein [Zoogloeaceae bacterium]
MPSADYTTEEFCLQPRLRIAIVTETYPPEINGVAMTMGRMVAGLVARGHQVQLIRPRQEASDRPARAPGVEELLARGVRIPRYEGLRFGLPASQSLARQWTHQRPDVVHVATEGPLGWSAVSAARKLRLPVTSDFHTQFDHYSGHYGMGWLRQPVAAYLRRFHNRTARTFVPTRALAATLTEQGYERVGVISRGVDTELFHPQRRSNALRAGWGIAYDGLAVICVGRVAAEKNLPLTLAAFARIRQARPDARLIIVGDGPLREALAQRHPDHIFAGLRVGEDLATHYASADLFLFPSVTETFGNVTLEAMASGVPLVAFDYAAARELFTPEIGGLAVPFGNEAAFVDAAQALACDEPRRRRLGTGGRQRVESHSWDHIHDEFAAALASACQGGNPPPRRFLSATRQLA